jgi:hypothetical protein
MAKRTFISFDYDNDADMKVMLDGQAKHPDTPFSTSDWSVKTPFTGDWKTKVRERMKKVEVVAVICGEHTDASPGVDAEVTIAQEEGIPYFLLWGRADKACKKPKTARATDQIYKWTWDNLKVLIGGGR